MYPFERFDEDAKKVLMLAQREAERAHHSYIGTEHLLLAILVSETEAARLLARLGVDEEKARANIASVLGRNERIVVQQIIPTSRVKKVIELSFQIAQREGSATVSPEHLLLGLLEEGEGIAAHVLEDLGVTSDTIAGRPGAARRPWPQPGARVLVHDPEPPYRLWEGTVSRYQDGLVLVSIPHHPRDPEARVKPMQLHAVPLRPEPTCDRCRYREDA